MSSTSTSSSSSMTDRRGNSSMVAPIYAYGDSSVPSTGSRSSSRRSSGATCITNLLSYGMVHNHACSMAVPFNNSNQQHVTMTQQISSYTTCSATNNVNSIGHGATNGNSPRVARSFVKTDSSYDESSQPSSFTSSFLHNHHSGRLLSNHHSHSHYFNGLVGAVIVAL